MHSLNSIKTLNELLTLTSSLPHGFVLVFAAAAVDRRLQGLETSGRMRQQRQTHQTENDVLEPTPG